jgi:hypothetical protein
MTQHKEYSYEQDKLIPISLSRQILPVNYLGFSGHAWLRLMPWLPIAIRTLFENDAQRPFPLPGNILLMCS